MGLYSVLVAGFVSRVFTAASLPNCFVIKSCYRVKQIGNIAGEKRGRVVLVFVSFSSVDMVDK